MYGESELSKANVSKYIIEIDDIIYILINFAGRLKRLMYVK